MAITTGVHPRLAPLFTEMDAFFSNPLLHVEFDKQYIEQLQSLFPESASLDRSQNLAKLADNVRTIQSGSRQMRACLSFDILALCAAESIAFKLERLVVLLPEKMMATLPSCGDYGVFRDTAGFGASAIFAMEKIADELLPESEDLADKVRFKDGITSQKLTGLLQEIINDLPKNERPETQLKDDREYQDRLSKYLDRKRQLN